MKIGKVVSSLLITCTLLLATPLAAYADNAPNTHFMYPAFGSTTLQPDNVPYISADIWFEEWSNGNNLCLLNYNGLDSVIAEAVANTYPAGAKWDSVDVYTNGADLSAANVNALYGAGWPRMDTTYQDWRIETKLQSTTETFAPRVATIDDATINDRIASAGFTDSFATIQVSGLTLPTVGVIYYAPDFSYLHASNYVYQYVEAGNYFSLLVNGTYNQYDPNMLEIDVQDYDVTMTDGIYVITNSELPAELRTPSYEDVTIAAGGNTSGRVATWNFAVKSATLAGAAQGSTDSGEDNAALAEKYAEVTAFLEDFDSNLELYWIEDGKISMSLAYSGDLPEGTTITVDLAGIPGTDATGAAMGADVSYSDDVMLYLYYCNPQSGLNEFVSSGIVKDGLVTFDISHCSDYIITDVDHGMSYKDEEEVLATEASEDIVGEDSTSTVKLVLWILGGAVVIGVLFTAGWLVYCKKSNRGNKKNEEL